MSLCVCLDSYNIYPLLAKWYASLIKHICTFGLRQTCPFSYNWKGNVGQEFYWILQTFMYNKHNLCQLTNQTTYMNIIKLSKKHLVFQSDQKLKLPLISNCNDSLPINLTSSQFFTLFPISQILTLHLIAMILLLTNRIPLCVASRTLMS